MTLVPKNGPPRWDRRDSGVAFRAVSRSRRGSEHLGLESLEGRLLLSGAPPTALNDQFITPVDIPLTVSAPGVLANDTDPENDLLTAVFVSDPSHGTLARNADGSFTYTPEAAFHGTDSFTYRANDGTSDSDLATVTVLVNIAPIAAEDRYAAVEDAALTIAGPGVLANDTDANNDPMTAVLVDAPTNGTVTLNPDGSFLYTPAADFNGIDVFTYRASDGLNSSGVATATIIVAAVNDPPVATANSYTTPVGVTLTIEAPGVLTDDFDIDGDGLTASVVDGPTNGIVTLNPDGSYVYTPNAGFVGTDSFTYRANDGTTTSGLAAVTITVASVNQVPVAAGDSYATDEDTALTIAGPGVLVNDTYSGSGLLTAALVDAPAHGTLTLNPDGSLVYAPAANFHGTDSFTYHASDGLNNSGLATVTIAVASVNDAPVATANSYTTPVDVVLTIEAPGVLTDDSDVDGDPLTASVVDSPAHGTLTLNPGGSFVYTPTAGFSGSDSFSYRVNDGTTTSGLATVTIAVAHVNHAPVAASDSYATNQDTALTITAPGVLANDTDADGNPLTVALVDAPAHGTLTLNPDGSFLYTPAAGFTGSDSFTYHANDGTIDSGLATATIAVAHVNHAPVAAGDSYTTNQDTALTIASPGVLGNDTDIDGDPLTVSVVDSPANGSLTLNPDGSFAYTPHAGFVGADSFTYRANDGTTASGLATVTIAVTHVNHAPVTAGDSYSTNQDTALTISTPGVLANDSDADTDPLTAVLVSGPAHGTLALSPGGSFVYTPAAGFSGSDSFSYRASDGSLTSGLATVTITVTHVNHAPVSASDSHTTNQDTALTIAAPGVLGNDTDADNDALTAVLVSGTSHGALTLNPNGSFNFTPATGFSGSDSFTYRASDGTLTSGLATVTITVAHVNHAPSAANDNYATDQDRALSILTPGVLANDLDIDGDTLATVLVSGTSHGALTLNPGGSFVYTPAAGFSGSDSFTYRASDGGLQSGTATVTLSVAHVNQPSVAVNDSYTTAAGAALSITAPGVLSNDTDPENDPITAMLMVAPSNGTLTLNLDGSFVYTPAAGFSGSDSFTYRVSDGNILSNIATATITVPAPANHAPTATSDDYATAQGVKLSAPIGAVLANDTDADNDALTAVLVDRPTHGTLTLQADGSFTYAPNSGFSGSDSFTYQASDGRGLSAVAAVTIKVAPAITPPILTGQGLPGNDTGIVGDLITANNATTFTGQAPAGYQIALYASGSGLSGQVLVGQATATAQGTYGVTSKALTDGSYHFVVTATPSSPGATPAATVSVGSLTIDTTAPRITGIQLNPKTGQLILTLSGDVSGLNPSLLLSPSSYGVIRPSAPRRQRNLAVTDVAVVGSNQVALVLAGGHKLSAGTFRVTAFSSGIADRAGNALDGEFRGAFPTGNGQAGGDFAAQFAFQGRKVNAPKAVPSVIAKAHASSIHPAGPLAHAKASRRGF